MKPNKYAAVEDNNHDGYYEVWKITDIHNNFVYFDNGYAIDESWVHFTSDVEDDVYNWIKQKHNCKLCPRNLKQLPYSSEDYHWVYQQKKNTYVGQGYFNKEIYFEIVKGHDHQPDNIYITITNAVGNSVQSSAIPVDILANILKQIGTNKV